MRLSWALIYGLFVYFVLFHLTLIFPDFIFIYNPIFHTLRLIGLNLGNSTARSNFNQSNVFYFSYSVDGHHTDDVKCFGVTGFSTKKVHVGSVKKFPKS